MQAQQQADLNMAGEHFEKERAVKTEKLQRVQVLSVHLNHNKRVAQEEGICSTCGRGLDCNTELPDFIAKQVRSKTRF